MFSIRRDIKGDGSVNKEAVDILDSSMQEMVQQLKVLEEIKDTDQEESYKNFHQE